MEKAGRWCGREGDRGGGRVERGKGDRDEDWEDGGVFESACAYPSLYRERAKSQLARQQLVRTSSVPSLVLRQDHTFTYVTLCPVKTDTILK